MRFPIGVVVGVMLSCSTMSYAQQGIIGTYEGGYIERTEHRPRPQTVTLEITTAQSGKLAGKLNLGNHECRGTHVVEGTYQDDKLDMRTGEGALRGCGNERLVLVFQGNKLVGTVSTYHLEMLRK